MSAGLTPLMRGAWAAGAGGRADGGRPEAAQLLAGLVGEGADGVVVNVGGDRAGLQAGEALDLPPLLGDVAPAFGLSLPLLPQFAGHGGGDGRAGRGDLAQERVVNVGAAQELEGGEALCELGHA